MTTEVQIAVPFFNEALFLEECLKSIQNQTFRNFSVIMADNHSNDGSENIAKKFLNDNRFHYFRQNKNLGAAKNFRFCFQKANSKYFMWLGAHDKISPDYLEKTLNAFCEDTSLVFSNTAWFLDGDKIEKITSASSFDAIEGSPFERFLKVLLFSGECTAVNHLFRRSLLEDYSFQYTLAEDLIILSHLIFKGKFRRIDEPLYYRRFFIKERRLSYGERIFGKKVSSSYLPFHLQYFKTYFKLAKSKNLIKRIFQALVILDKSIRKFGLNRKD